MPGLLLAAEGDAHVDHDPLAVRSGGQSRRARDSCRSRRRRRAAGRRIRPFQRRFSRHARGCGPIGSKKRRRQRCGARRRRRISSRSAPSASRPRTRPRSLRRRAARATACPWARRGRAKRGGCAGKPRPRPSARATRARCGERFERVGRCHGHAVGGKARPPARADPRGGCATLMPKPITTTERLSPVLADILEQDAGDLRAVEQHVVRPFEQTARTRRLIGDQLGDGLVSDEARDEARAGRDARSGSCSADQAGWRRDCPAGETIRARRRPRPATAAPTRSTADPARQPSARGAPRRWSSSIVSSPSKPIAGRQFRRWRCESYRHLEQ